MSEREGRNDDTQLPSAELKMRIRNLEMDLVGAMPVNNFNVEPHTDTRSEPARRVAVSNPEGGNNDRQLEFEMRVNRPEMALAGAMPVNNSNVEHHTDTRRKPAKHVAVSGPQPVVDQTRHVLAATSSRSNVYPCPYPGCKENTKKQLRLHFKKMHKGVDPTSYFYKRQGRPSRPLALCLAEGKDRNLCGKEILWTDRARHYNKKHFSTYKYKLGTAEYNSLFQKIAAGDNVSRMSAIDEAIEGYALAKVGTVKSLKEEKAMIRDMWRDGWISETNTLALRVQALQRGNSLKYKRLGILSKFVEHMIFRQEKHNVLTRMRWQSLQPQIDNLKRVYSKRKRQDSDAALIKSNDLVNEAFPKFRKLMISKRHARSLKERITHESFNRVLAALVVENMSYSSARILSFTGITYSEFNSMIGKTLPHNEPRFSLRESRSPAQMENFSLSKTEYIRFQNLVNFSNKTHEPDLPALRRLNTEPYTSNDMSRNTRKYLKSFGLPNGFLHQELRMLANTIGSDLIQPSSNPDVAAAGNHGVPVANRHYLALDFNVRASMRAGEKKKRRDVFRDRKYAGLTLHDALHLAGYGFIFESIGTSVQGDEMSNAETHANECEDSPSDAEQVHDSDMSDSDVSEGWLEMKRAPTKITRQKRSRVAFRASIDGAAGRDENYYGRIVTTGHCFHPYTATRARRQPTGNADRSGARMLGNQSGNSKLMEYECRVVLENCMVTKTSGQIEFNEKR